MNKKHVIFHVLYYALNIVVYMAFSYMAFLVLKRSGGTDNPGFVMMVTYDVLFVMTPVLVAVLMRFSLFKWYVDPIAAAEIPLFLYIGMLFNHMKRSGDFRSAFLLVNNKLGDDGGMGWLFLVGLFIFGLIMSLSFARKKGQSISYRLLSKLSNKEKDDSVEESVQYDASEAYHKTDWNFDFSSLPNWSNRDSVPFVYDKFYPIPQQDILCCIYSIAEVRMGWYIGSLAILKNKNSPELLLNISEGVNFCDNFSVNQSGDIIFLQASIYNKTMNSVICPVLIIDIAQAKVSYYITDNFNPCYKIIETDDYIFSIEADETQRKADERLNTFAKQKIDLCRLKWYNFSEINTIANKIKASDVGEEQG